MPCLSDASQQWESPVDTEVCVPCVSVLAGSGVSLFKAINFAVRQILAGPPTCSMLTLNFGQSFHLTSFVNLYRLIVPELNSLAD